MISEKWKMKLGPQRWAVYLQGLTFTQDVNGVSFTELQVLWALSRVVIQRQHFIENAAVGQGVFSLKTFSTKQQQT